MATRRIAILGTSSIFYQEGDAPTLPRLIEAALTRRAPSTTWVCDPRLLYLSPRSAGRAGALTRQAEADLVILFLDAC